jgi:hypothetical protein
VTIRTGGHSAAHQQWPGQPISPGSGGPMIAGSLGLAYWQVHPADAIPLRAGTVVPTIPRTLGPIWAGCRARCPAQELGQRLPLEVGRWVGASARRRAVRQRSDTGADLNHDDERDDDQDRASYFSTSMTALVVGMRLILVVAAAPRRGRSSDSAPPPSSAARALPDRAELVARRSGPAARTRSSWPSAISAPRITLSRSAGSLRRPKRDR